MSTSMTKADCGCGRSGGDCACGGAGGAQICTDLNFKRPRFFAGQLLTEDDLQALTDYVVGKNRLRNRFLFGDGVVCGLSVTCHPCGEGRVTVAPGFALDCCGNDILVPCKEELDVKALLRDLRKRQLAGHDCGDPCDEKDGGKRSYGLYLTYTETLEDPVAPYSSGDPCGQQGCEPTRVCEGYRFELRCDCDQPARTDLFKRVAACIGDLRQAEAALSRALTADVQASRLRSAAGVIRAGTAVPFDESSVRVLGKLTPELARLNELSLEEDLDDDGLPRLKPNEPTLRLDVARLQLLTGAVTRFRALPDNEREAVPDADGKLDALLAEAEAVMAEAGPRIEALAPAVLKTPIARTEAMESVRLSRKYVLEPVSDDLFETVEAQMVALNTPVSFRQRNRMKSDAALLKDWLLDKLADSTTLTRCNLHDRLRCIRVEPEPGDGIGEDIAGIDASARAVKDLVTILLEYLIDCICLALNPPCQPCEDRGVLLACLTVEDCEVIDICNMSRRFVLTPTSIRYWLPPIGVIGDLLKRLCCDLDVGRLVGRAGRHSESRPGDAVARLMVNRPEEMTIAETHAPVLSEAAIDDDTALVLRQFRIEPAELETVTSFSSNLALLSARSAGLDRAAVARRGTAISELIAGRLDVGTLQGDETIRARVADAVAEEVSAARESVVQELGGALEQRVNDDVESAVARELTGAKLRRAVQGVSTIKTLRDANRKLTRELKKLSDTVEAMRKGG